MSKRTPLLLLLAAFALPLSVQAQPAGPAGEEAQVSDEQQAAQDLGTLQAELARVEAERQRLADELARGGNSDQLEQLRAQNIILRDRLAAQEELNDTQRADEQRKWFMVGGSTVALSLLAGWLLAQLGGRRKRNMWLN